MQHPRLKPEVKSHKLPSVALGLTHLRVMTSQ